MTLLSYYVTYLWWGKPAAGDQGAGCTNYTSRSPISTYDDVLFISKKIKENNPNFENVIVTNYIRLEDRTEDAGKKT